MNFNYQNITLIIISSLLLSFAYNHFNPDGLKLIREERKIIWENDSITINQKELSDDLNEPVKIESDSTKNLPVKQDQNLNFSEPKAIKLDFAHKLFKQGIKFIDARPVEEYNEGHIKGAINIPFYDSHKYLHLLSKISKDEIIVTYCSGHDCELSIMLGDELFSKGYKRIYIFYGGWNDWLENNYPIEK
jgi:rhodanese-related sulfurtransferase